MGMSTGGGGRSAMSEINVTPFVDVMLVLLIIFMVAGPLIPKDQEEQREVDVDLPVTKDNPNTVSLKDTSKIILVIDDKLKVSIGEAVLTDCSDALGKTDVKRFEPCFEQIETALGQNEKLKEEKTLYILADANIPYGFVVGSMNRIKKAGVNNVGMVTNPEYLKK